MVRLVCYGFAFCIGAVFSCYGLLAAAARLVKHYPTN
jgi:hypothetical protein